MHLGSTLTLFYDVTVGVIVIVTLILCINCGPPGVQKLTRHSIVNPNGKMGRLLYVVNKKS